MNSIHQHFILEFMFVILYTFTKIQQYVLSSVGTDIFIFIYLIVINVYNIVHSFSFVLSLLVLSMFCNIQVSPLFFSFIFFKFHINIIFYIFFKSSIALTNCDDTYHINSLSLVLYQKGKFVSVVPLSFIS